MEANGRLTLPVGAWPTEVAGASVGAFSQGDWFVLRWAAEQVGAEVNVDRRRRLSIPVWLRRQAETTGSLLVAASTPPGPVVAVAATTVLDDLFDRLLAEAS